MGTWTAAQCARNWKIEESTWRGYVTSGRAPAPLPGWDEQRRRRWDEDAVRAWVRPGQGFRADRPLGNHAATLAAIVLRMAAESDVVPRAALRSEWIGEYPEHVDGYKLVTGGTAVDAPRARTAVQRTLVKLERAGLIQRGRTTITVLDRAGLAAVADGVRDRSTGEQDAPRADEAGRQAPRARSGPGSPVRQDTHSQALDPAQSATATSEGLPTARGETVRRVGADDVAAQYRQAIWAGQYRRGDLLPRADDAAVQFGADRKTVLDAYHQLAAEGLVEVRRRAGTVVICEAIMADGDPDQTSTVRRVPAVPDVAAALLLPLGAEVIQRAQLERDSGGRPTRWLASWYRVCDVAGSPIETSRVGAAAGSGEVFSTLGVLGLGPTDATEEIVSRMPSPGEAALLELPPMVPVADLTRYTRRQHYLVEYTRGLYVGPRFRWRHNFPYPAREHDRGTGKVTGAR